ncbi:MAG: NAD(P)/FAD-dependent oxidoreductase, partial [Myxococcales bacterium]|nr:NAD(P)/FAD-dependent oxidoreductase [Myxococcales bacterium]
MNDEQRQSDKYWDKKGKPGPWDAIVIGSGMGGMTTAAMLAKLGQRVLVLEQHYVPGGFTHMFKRKSWVWDVGVHAVGEVTTRSMPGRVLAALSDGDLKWASLGPVYDEFYFPDEFRIDFPDSPQQFRANLVEAFPSEVGAIDGYLDLVRRVSGSMRGYYFARVLPQWSAPVANRLLASEAETWFRRRTAPELATLTDNPKLRSLFAAQWGYYGSTPSRSSFAIQALVVKHFLHGGYYPIGGAKEIARTLLRTVANAGGWTRIRADVEEIIVEKGTAVGVRMKDGEEIRAPRVISA